MEGPSGASALLIDAPVGRHFAQLHRQGDGLVRSVGLFIETGLRRDCSVVVIASDAHTERFLARLRRNGFDTEECRRSGQLIIRDARAMLRQFMTGGVPDWRRFRHAVGPILESAQNFGRSTTRAYGELVNVLWRAGQPEAAIRLEVYWNELAALYPFSLFCGYMLDSHDIQTYRSPLHEIGRTHSDILATDEDERFRAALDAASRDVFGIPLARIVHSVDVEDHPGEHRLPAAQRTVLWVMRHLPSSSAELLERARWYLHGKSVPPS